MFLKKISHADFERPLLKVTSRSPALVDGTLLNTTFSAEIMPFSLKNGRFYSNWAETQTTMTDSQSAYALLVPVDIAIRKKGESVPENGVLVKTGEVLEFALSPTLFDVEKLLETKIYWLHCELQPDATYGPWTYFGLNGRETKFEQSMAFGGIYQIKAKFIDGRAEYLYTRKKDEKIGKFEYGPGKKGDPDRIGICDKQIQIDTCREAQTFYGSDVYSAQFVLPAQYGFPGYPNEGSSIIRCKIFVAHRATAAGASVPKINGFFNEYPPLANEWAGIEDTSIFPGNPTYI